MKANVIFLVYAILSIVIVTTLLALDLTAYLIPTSALLIAGVFVCLYLVLNSNASETQNHS